MTDKATEAQIDAANSMQSTWLSANAGSGKTRVLTNRVARLLLRGTDPRNILCLTYTKAAASEMQNRLFKTLGSWAMLDDGKLHERLAELGEAAPDDLSEARTLFARAIEAPGGLRIQTIHALCASILRQFPLEGGVSPQFRELDEAAQTDLIESVLENLAQSDEESLAALAAFHSDEDLTGLARKVASRADDFAIAHGQTQIFRAFGLPPDQTEENLVEMAISADDLSFLRDFGNALRISDKTSDHKLSDVLIALPDDPSLAVLARLEVPFLLGETSKSPFAAKIGSIPTKKIRESASFAPMMGRFNEIMERVETARVQRIALEAARKTLATHHFAQAFLPAYEASKLHHGALDFDDLIRRTRDMLTGPALAWVLYRLDGRIDHVLVDEAQDTSPAQWQIIRALTEAMADDQDRVRTLFVVGDKKQSIYSFQGADAEGFDTKEREFNDQLDGRLRSRELLYSFRSSPAILKLVDAVSDGLGGLGDRVLHHAFHAKKPGRVDLLPLVPQPEKAPKPNWFDPVDRPVDSAPAVKLGKRIADTITQLLEKETIQGKNGEIRPVVAGDIMVLVQKRSGVFDQIIQACKGEGLPIAGSDRLRIGAELAVRDLLALLAFLDLPEDDLSLAAALRSPLFGLTESELFDLASNRPPNSPLWAELRRRSEDFPEAVATLDALRRQVDFLRPFELLEHILGQFNGRARLLARLGAEAEDGIDELLRQAIAYERENVPSLTGFLTKAQSEDIEVKRDADASDHLIRVMTVHGAKGLERPIVILPDTSGSGQGRTDGIFVSESGLPVLSVTKAESPPLVADARAKLSRADADERNRLLYVAMTRAESWLIVAGIEPAQNTSALNWHETIKAAMIRIGAAKGGLDAEGLRYSEGDWPDAGTLDRRIQAPRDQVDLTKLDTRAPEPLALPGFVAPSDLGGAKVLGGGALDEDRAKRRGRQLHVLLEHLPGRQDQVETAGRLLAIGPDKASAEEIPELVNEALRNLSLHPRLFSADAMAEVDITAHLPRVERHISGRIDRLLVEEGRILCVDFKTNSIVPEVPGDVPEGLLRQMGAYLEALEQVYPDRRIVVAILWTANGQLMELPHAIVREALQRTTIS